METKDHYHLIRFIEAQEPVYETALMELQNGKKQSHWMWFIFPQLSDLGRSSMAKYYGISGMDEARAYLQQPLLRERLEVCFKAVLACGEQDPIKIFGYPDYMKFHSSLTLFALAEPENSIFKEALAHFYQEKNEDQTLMIISKP